MYERHILQIQRRSLNGEATFTNFSISAEHQRLREEEAEVFGRVEKEAIARDTKRGHEKD